MSNKWYGKVTAWNRGLLWGWVLLACLGLAGCGPETEQDSRGGGTQTEEGAEESGKEDFLPNDTFQVENPEEENIADLVQKTAAGAMVRIQAGRLTGSGVILAMDEKETVIVTAAHVLEEENRASVTFVDGFEAEGGDVFLSETADAAFIRLDTGMLQGAGREDYRYAAVDKLSFDALKTGDIIVVMGSAGGVGADAYEGELLEPWIFLEDFNQYMMLGRTYAFSGMSGGGIFDAKGYFIGILCGGNEKNEIAVLPWSVINTEYERLLAADA